MKRARRLCFARFSMQKKQKQRGQVRVERIPAPFLLLFLTSLHTNFLIAFNLLEHRILGQFYSYFAPHVLALYTLF